MAGRLDRLGGAFTVECASTTPWLMPSHSPQSSAFTMSHFIHSAAVGHLSLPASAKHMRMPQLTCVTVNPSVRKQLGSSIFANGNHRLTLTLYKM